ncbi:MAG: PRC-barrel domain-containing protein [Deferrisomatales bacterium]
MKKSALIVAGIMGATCFTGGALASDDMKKGEKASQNYEQGRSLEKFGKVIRADKINGMQVKNAAGEDLGEVQQILIDADQGRIAYVILASGGVLGVGEDQYIVPFSSLRQNASGEHFTLNMDTQKLKDGPKYAERRLDDPKFGQQVHSYYGVSPYWTEAGAQQRQWNERNERNDRVGAEKMNQDNMMMMMKDGEGMKRGTQENKQ